MRPASYVCSEGPRVQTLHLCYMLMLAELLPASCCQNKCSHFKCYILHRSCLVAHDVVKTTKAVIVSLIVLPNHSETSLELTVSNIKSRPTLSTRILRVARKTGKVRFENQVWYIWPRNNKPQTAQKYRNSWKSEQNCIIWLKGPKRFDNKKW